MPFARVTEADIEDMYRTLACGLYRDSTYSAVTQLGWQAIHNGRFLTTPAYRLYAVDYDGETFYFPPLAPTREGFEQGIAAYEAMGVTTVWNVCDWQAKWLEARGYTITHSRDMSEYLYLRSDLEELRGKRYHAKRNFLHSFPLPYTFRPYQPGDFDAVLDLLHHWQAEHGEARNFDPSDDAANMEEYDDYLTEEYALRYALTHPDLCRVVAGVLEADGHVVGFALGERMLWCDTGVIYFEKGDINYKGVYPLLDNLFIRTFFHDLTYVNKQEDMGLEGLRHSKTSYCPVAMLDRFVAEAPCRA